MRKLIYLMIMLVSIAVVSVNDIGAFGLFRNAKVTLQVVDDSGKPVSGAKVGVGFDGPGGKYTGKNGFTGEDGLFTASDECYGKIQYGAEKEGYYRSHYSYSFKSMGTFMWEPWNPELKVLLRKIENPVPMYAIKKLMSIKSENKKIGFDFVVGDLVKPYGTGKNVDMTIYVKKRVTSETDMEANMIIHFENKYDGIMNIKENTKNGSKFSLPRFAPEQGYSADYEVTVSRAPEQWYQESYNDDDNFMFRIRSEEKDGKFLRAMYGKIRGPIAFYPARSKLAQFEMTYYLNPDYTRNLEFDPKRNLFGNLPDSERVTEP